MTTDSASGALFRPEAIGDLSFIIGSSDGVLVTGVLCFIDGSGFGSGCRTRGAEQKWKWRAINKLSDCYVQTRQK